MVMSHCIVPNWNLKHQRQEQVEEADQIQGGGERINRSSHHVNNNNITVQQHQQYNNSHLSPMSKHEVAEIMWENGQLAMQALGGLLHTPPIKATWGRSNDTLESIVHQATYHNNKDVALNSLQHNQTSPQKMTPGVATSSGKCSESSGRVPMVPEMLKKRTRPESNECGRNFGRNMQDERADRSGYARASATFCRDIDDTTDMTWASYESSRSFKTKITTDEDSACHDASEDQDEDHETKMETGRSRSLRRSRAAAIHNQSERRRRDRINQKMKALQRLVPNASKTDKASMLDEVIDYLKQLQAQVQMMSARSMPQMNMMMPLIMQQHLQMAQLARMGMGVGLGMGMGMLDINTMAATARSPLQSIPPLIHPTAPVSATTPAPFVPSPFMVPPMIATCTPAAQANSGAGDSNASSMNMELYNKMAALYRQHVNQSNQQQATSSPSIQSDHMQGE